MQRTHAERKLGGADPPPERVIAALRDLRRARVQVQRLLDRDLHPLVRQQVERIAEALEIQTRAWETQDAELLEEANAIRERAPKGLRGLSALPDGTAWLLSEKNIESWRASGEPDQVWIRWDQLSVDQREIAASLASYLRDLTGKRKPAGRPRRNPLSK